MMRFMTLRWMRLAAAILAVLAGWPADLTMMAAEAQARSRSSGGYSRPSVRTPSLSGPSSGGDLGLSRRGSAEALQRYRSQSQPQLSTRRPSAGSGSSRRGWTPPPYAAPSPGFGGLGNALMMWFLLDTLTRPGHADYFHNHQDQPTYRQWRQEADKRAEDDPELRAKLKQLDNQLAERGGQPKDPGTVPPDVPRQAARQDGGGFPLIPVALLGVGLVVLWRARRRGGAGSPLGLAGRMARQKLGSPPAASPYRLGMTFTLDQSPFLLAGAATKVRPPPGGMTSIAAIGRLEAGETMLDRLYLPEDQGFFQLHAQGGAVDECRFFSPLDQIVPADAREWSFWLDPVEGVIGWPSFEAKDGKLYQRAWRPGGARIEPIIFSETRNDLSGTRMRKLSAMLYAARLEAPPPAPQVEYVLVAAMEDGAQAWIEIHAGLDINPASLSLPS